jgi:hypothetical protein
MVLFIIMVMVCGRWSQSLVVFPHSFLGVLECLKKRPGSIFTVIMTARLGFYRYKYGPARMNRNKSAWLECYR